MRTPDSVVADLVARDRERQGLPPRIEDPEPLQRIAVVLADGMARSESEASRPRRNAA